ncbi:MAG: type II toxin-antitoxin system Phd/YefM family antitoxin [Leptolyngbya sp. BL-A-14]
MQQVNLKDAATQLADLVEAAASGEDVVITRSDGASFQIVPLAKPRPKFGSAKGLVSISEDFDAPLEAFEDYAP